MTYYQELKREQKWEEKFLLLLKYRDKYGTVQVPKRYYNQSYPEWERKLGAWCCTQRRYYKTGKIKSWQYEKLNSVGFEFEPFETKFENHFNDFLKFKEKYGHTLVPQDCNEFPSLGSWVSHLRWKPVKPERRKRLDEVGFVWDSIDEYWQVMYRELIEFKKKFGHCKVPEKRKEFNKLGTWVVRMRKSKRCGKCQKLSETQILLLDSIGFNWEPKICDWENNIAKLEQFKNEHGHCLVPIRRCKIKGLGWWVYWLRKNKHKLTAEQIQQLDSYGFEWSADIAYRTRNNIKPAKPISS